MPAATQQRLNIELDTRVPLEAMILNRLQRLPSSRRTQWLRHLLVGGFSTECQAIKSQTLPVHSPGAGDDLSWEHPRPHVFVSQEHPLQSGAPVGIGDQERLVNPAIQGSTPLTKPFAHLKSVMGR